MRPTSTHGNISQRVLASEVTELLPKNRVWQSFLACVWRDADSAIQTAATEKAVRVIKRCNVV